MFYKTIDFKLKTQWALMSFTSCKMGTLGPRWLLPADVWSLVWLAALPPVIPVFRFKYDRYNMGRGLCSKKTINYVFSSWWHFLFALPCRNKTLHIHLRNFAWLITVDYPLIESGLDQLCLTNKDTRLESALPSETTAETAITKLRNIGRCLPS